MTASPVQKRGIQRLRRHFGEQETRRRVIGKWPGVTEADVNAQFAIFEAEEPGATIFEAAASKSAPRKVTLTPAMLTEAARLATMKALEAAGVTPGTASQTDPSKMTTGELLAALGVQAPAMFRAFGESAGGRQITESAVTAPSTSDAISQRAKAIVDRVTAIEERGLPNASIADLASLAAAYVPR